MNNKKVEKAFAVTGGLNGLKTIIGAVLIVISYQVGALNELIAIYPEVSVFKSVATALEYFTLGAEWLLTLVGNGFVGVGIVHKVLKVLS